MAIPVFDLKAANLVIFYECRNEMPIDLIADVQPAKAGGRGGRGGGIKGTAHEITPSKATNGEPHYKKELLCALADAGTFIVGLQKQCGRCVNVGRRTPFCGAATASV